MAVEICSTTTLPQCTPLTPLTPIHRVPLIPAGLQLAELCMPPEVVAEAREIAAKIERDQRDGGSESVEAQTRAATYTLGTQLVQIARNSLLDTDSLR